MTYAADAKFLRNAANHFERRPTDGEDLAHWANVYNAENCRRIADYVERLAPTQTPSPTPQDNSNVNR